MKNSEEITLDFSVEPFPETESAVPMPESFEEGTKEEISEVLSAFRQRAKDEEAAKAKNVSTDFWFAVYFASQEQRDVFLRAVNLVMHLDDQYIDSMTFARAVGVDIPNEEITAPKAFRRPAGIDDLVLDL